MPAISPQVRRRLTSKWPPRYRMQFMYLRSFSSQFKSRLSSNHFFKSKLNNRFVMLTGID